MTLKPLAEAPEYQDPQGMNLQLCVMHELNPEEQYSVQAIVVYHGSSLCREHLERLQQKSIFLKGNWGI
jgi:hypothetical protein